MSAVCPKCGVVVVPGYVKCPKCQATLPQKRGQASAAGGTSVRGGGVPLPMILLAVAALGAVVVVLAVRGGDKPAAIEPRPAVAPVTTEPVERPVAPDPDVVAPTTPQPVASDPTLAVRDLDRALKKERLWGTVEVVGSRVDVRSGACADAAMMPLIEAAIPALREGGVAKIRCRAQGGAVVFEREI